MQYLDMLTGVLPEVEGCPEDAAARAMRQACIDWCESTFCLTNPVEIVTTNADPEAIDLTAMWVVKIIEARIDGETVDVFAANDPALAELGTGEQAIVYADPGSPYVVPAPSAPVTVELLVAVAPGPDSTEVPDLIWQRYHESLEHGALARLMAKGGKSWTNEREAMRRAGLFEAAKTRIAARLGVNRVTTAQRLRVQPV